MVMIGGVELTMKRRQSLTKALISIQFVVVFVAWVCAAVCFRVVYIIKDFRAMVDSDWHSYVPPLTITLVSLIGGMVACVELYTVWDLGKPNRGYGGSLRCGTTSYKFLVLVTIGGCLGASVALFTEPKALNELLVRHLEELLHRYTHNSSIGIVEINRLQGQFQCCGIEVSSSAAEPAPSHIWSGEEWESTNFTGKTGMNLAWSCCDWNYQGMCHHLQIGDGAQELIRASTNRGRGCRRAFIRWISLYYYPVASLMMLLVLLQIPAAVISRYLETSTSMAVWTNLSIDVTASGYLWQGAGAAKLYPAYEQVGKPVKKAVIAGSLPQTSDTEKPANVVIKS